LREPFGSWRARSADRYAERADIGGADVIRVIVQSPIQTPSVFQDRGGAVERGAVRAN
jgi:hypothetical protein